jgi:hypothetical protein
VIVEKKNDLKMLTDLNPEYEEVSSEMPSFCLSVCRYVRKYVCMDARLASVRKSGRTSVVSRVKNNLAPKTEGVHIGPKKKKMIFSKKG